MTLKYIYSYNIEIYFVLNWNKRNGYDKGVWFYNWIFIGKGNVLFDAHVIWKLSMNKRSLKFQWFMFILSVIVGCKKTNNFTKIIMKFYHGIKHMLDYLKVSSFI